MCGAQRSPQWHGFHSAQVLGKLLMPKVGRSSSSPPCRRSGNWVLQNQRLCGVSGLEQGRIELHRHPLRCQRRTRVQPRSYPACALGWCWHLQTPVSRVMGKACRRARKCCTRSPACLCSGGTPVSPALPAAPAGSWHCREGGGDSSAPSAAAFPCLSVTGPAQQWGAMGGEGSGSVCGSWQCQGKAERSGPCAHLPC